MFAKFLVRAVFAALGLWVASMVIPGVEVRSTAALALAVLFLGVVNAIVRPVVVILTLPLTILTLGVFLLVVNAMMIGLVAWFLPGFAINGLVPGMLAAIITGVSSWIGGIIASDHRR